VLQAVWLLRNEGLVHGFAAARYGCSGTVWMLASAMVGVHPHSQVHLKVGVYIVDRHVTSLLADHLLYVCAVVPCRLHRRHHPCVHCLPLRGVSHGITRVMLPGAGPRCCRTCTAACSQQRILRQQVLRRRWRGSRGSWPAVQQQQLRHVVSGHSVFRCNCPLGGFIGGCNASLWQLQKQDTSRACICTGMPVLTLVRAPCTDSSVAACRNLYKITRLYTQQIVPPSGS
jgi:hypothetical protein